ncbi:E3 ubiquitin/ISG15 ligase TRIM25-like [Ruditapes philippinarum]|uniref:E3 ubiquitin/ISG15 ligase TRIM25-like n=1 Tax=Ruditapes philippinarum TaxID=129788 RepID=UPI00295C2249|nr:E3 ubiquitin/ISG15 ligase TRIM25-like [Ruditapes philippinarum]
MAELYSKPLHLEDTKHCTPCKTKDRKTKPEHYCTECEAYYCEECFELHTRVPYLAKHIVLKHGDIDVWSRDQYMCSTHGKNLEFFCKEHKMLCCHVCISLKHRSCTDMEYISESAMQSNLKDHIKKMNEKIVDQLQMIESHTGGIRKKAVTNQLSKTEYIKELESFRSRIKAMFDSLLEKAFEEMNERFDKNTKYADNSNRKLGRSKSRLNDLQQQLKSTTVGKEVLVYISLKRGENLIEEISKELSNIDLSADNDFYKPVIDEKIEKYVKELQKIAFLEDEKMRQECVASEDCRKEDFKAGGKIFIIKVN